MGKKGKGRSSAKAQYHFDIQQELQKASTREKPGRLTTKLSQRPRLTTGLSTLRNLIRERRSYEHYEWTEQRRREGYLPQQSKAVAHPNIVDIDPTELLGTTILSAAERSSLFENSGSSSLQTMCLKVLGEYLVEYLDAMGMEQLHGVLSLLPSETLGALSMLTSHSNGVDNNLAFVLGHHPHVTSLSFRATNVDDSLNGDGLLSLLPEVEEGAKFRLQSSWEDLDGDEDNENDVLPSIEGDGTAFRLKRLELVECPSITVDALLAFLEKQPFIRRLSIAGCFNREDEGGKLLRVLPQLLPSLESLDLRRCSWASRACIQDLVRMYEGNQNGSPEIHFQDGQIYGGNEAW